MIGSECRRRRSNQFNNVLLNVQDRVNCNKITEIREERIANSFILIRPLPVPTSSPQATHLRFSNYLCKTLLQLLNHLGIPLPCVQDSYIPRDKQSLNHNNSFQKVQKFFSLLEKIIQVEDLKRILN